MEKETIRKATDKAGRFINKTKQALTKAVDKNNDGKFDANDVSIVAEAVSNSFKAGKENLKQSITEKAIELELKSLQPIFVDNIDSGDFILPKFIRVVDREKRFINSKACVNAIGYYSDFKTMRMVNLFRDSVDLYGISFYPDNSHEFYYVDPSDRDRYISLDDYFGYLKVERISELQKIAQDLGATHFRVTYMEEQTSFSENVTKANIKASFITSGNGEHISKERIFSTVEIAAEMDCPGHQPIKPQLKYLQRDPSIRTLIDMRFDEKSPLSHQRFTLKLSNSSGMKESDAVKIDAVLKSIKCSGNTTVTSEAKNESRRYLDYEIDF